MAFQVPDGSLPPPYIPVVQVPVAAAPPVLPVLAPPPVCCVTPIHPPRWLLTERFQMRALRPRSFSCMCHNPRVAGQGAPRATALSTLEILSQGAAPLRRRGPAPAAARPRGLPSVIAAAQEPLPIGNVATYVPLYDYFYVGVQSYVLPAQLFAPLHILPASPPVLFAHAGPPQQLLPAHLGAVPCMQPASVGIPPSISAQGGLSPATYVQEPLQESLNEGSQASELPHSLGSSSTHASLPGIFLP